VPQQQLDVIDRIDAENHKPEAIPASWRLEASRADAALPHAFQDSIGRVGTLMPRVKTICAVAILLVAASEPLMVKAQAASSDSETRIADVRLKISRSQFTQAEQDLRKILAERQDAAEAHYLLGYTLFRQRRLPESLAEYAAGGRLRMPTADELTVVASDYILLKDLPDAEKWLLYATTHDPSNAFAWYLLGRAQYNQDHAADAAHSFEYCLELNPRDVRAEYNLGLVYEKLQRPTDAIIAYKNSILWQSSIQEQDPQPYLDLGTLLLRQEKAAEAIGPLTEAVHFGSRNALAHQELGLAFESLGRYDEALSALQRAAELAPTSEQPHFFLGRIYRHLGRKEDAAAEYAIVSKLIGSHSDAATMNADQQP
jgi:Flp pilus assembly protein TadD